MSPALVASDVARIEIARVRGWSARGAHGRAAEALDRALTALDAAEAAAPSPAVQQAIACLRAELERVTG